MERDRYVLKTLNADGWRVLVVWECALKGRNRRPIKDVLRRAERFIQHGQEYVAEIAEYE